MRKLIAGNWKMNGLLADGLALARDLAALSRRAEGPRRDLLICPPAQLLVPLAVALEGSGIALGGQDCHQDASGAHTGEISAEMLADVGCSHVILGHSERRSDNRETSRLVRAKAERARAAGLAPIVCVGETEAERVAGRMRGIVERQVRNSVPTDGATPGLVVAYEPVWAIGTGRTASPEDVAGAHGLIRGLLGDLLGPGAGGAVRILYGGSVKPANAAQLLQVPDVDGALVGGASLSAEDFWAIAQSCP